MYSSRAFQQCVAWCQMSTITEVSDECFFEKKTSERVIFRERKLETFGEIVFFWRTFKTESFGVYKNVEIQKIFFPNINAKVSLAIFSSE